MGLCRNQAKSIIREICQRAVDRGERRQAINSEVGPSKKYMCGFYQRHPKLSDRTAETVDRGRINMANQDTISDNFKTLKSALIETSVAEVDENNEVVCQHAERIYLADETGWGAEKKSRKVVGRKGATHAHVRKPSDESHKTMLAVCGNGDVLKSLIILEKSFPMLDSADSFFLLPTVPLEVEKIIDALNANKATGPMSIPVFILKRFKNFFSFWISKLINLCFETGIFPDILKIAKVIPLHKKESKLNFLNYRHISSLSVISKVYEKLIFTRIFAYLDKKDLIYSKQFGFWSGYSTNHALLSITERIRTMYSGPYVCGIFTDLEKAFDTVNHSILCEKLNYYGLRGNVNKLIQSYLSNRWQYVSINGFDSDCRNVSCRVPQGSSLGRLLFLV